MNPRSESPQRKHRLSSIKSINQLANTYFDLDSYYTQKAMRKCGYIESDFTVKEKKDFRETKSDTEDIINLRYEHYTTKLIKMVNKVLEEQENLRYTDKYNAKLLKSTRNPKTSNFETSMKSVGKLSLLKSRFEQLKEPQTARALDPNKISRKMELMVKHDQEVMAKEKQREEKESKKIKKFQKTIRMAVNQKRAQKEKLETKHEEKKKQILFEEERKKSSIQKAIRERERRANENISNNMATIREKLEEKDMYYAEKQRKVIDHMKSMEEIEFRRSMERLEVIENKQKRSERVHESILSKRINEAHKKNQLTKTKLERYKSLQEDIYQSRRNDIVLKESKTIKKLSKLQKQKRNFAKTLKKTMNTNFDKKQQILHSQEIVDNTRKKQLMKKMKRNMEKVEEIKQNTQKQIQLKRELHKIKQQEIEQERQRLKRIENIHIKSEVIDKHKKIQDSLQESKRMVQVIEKAKGEENRLVLKRKDEMIGRMDNNEVWSKGK
ncbi:unnamed protein product [Moneuplotes crassus]|uniref:Uncharacterized protein n=1 Tax=Euplotes crassus TaxID=5936 RepID=A0AAD1X4L8_EUPCR|nr:unnamed protein product [Moneuplotes crassus]